MSGLNVKSAARGLVFSAQLLAAPLASSAASAQEAILLETIGAVRMAQPDEVRRTAAERENAHGQAQQRHTEQEAAAR